MTRIDIARDWRQANGYVGRGGVVVLFKGEVQSWGSYFTHSINNGKIRDERA